MSTIRVGRALVLLGVVIATGGCPFLRPPDYQPELIVSPDRLDFGTSETTKTFVVRKVWSSRPIPPFQVTASETWVILSPTSGESTGPSDPVTITVTVDRPNMPAGRNSATITVAAAGVVPKYVSVEARVPLAADFKAENTVAFPGEAIQFVDQSTEEIPDKAIVSWAWDFGDGSEGPERFDKNPVHTYETAGTYTVSLTVSTGTLTAQKIKENYITILQKTPPTADFRASTTTVIAPGAVSFQDLSIQGSKPITSWVWDFFDGTSGPERFLQNPTHIYAATAQYQYSYPVSLTVTTEHRADTELKLDYITVVTPGMPGDPSLKDAAGESDGDASLKAAFRIAYPWDAPFKWFIVGEDVAFVNMSKCPESGTAFLWAFGDGNMSTAIEPIHVYQLPSVQGPYVPKLTVVSSSNADMSVDGNGLHVFPPTPLDEYLRTSLAGYRSGLSRRGAAPLEEGAAHRWVMTSQIYPGDEDNPQGMTLNHAMAAATPVGQKGDTGILIVCDAIEPDASDMAALVRAATDSHKVVAVLYRSVDQPASAFAGVASVVRALDAVQELLGIDAPSSFVVAGDRESAWWTWLAAATDRRVQAVNCAPATDAPAEIGDIEEYAARVRIPMIDLETAETGAAGIRAVLNALDRTSE